MPGTSKDNFHAQIVRIWVRKKAKSRQAQPVPAPLPRVTRLMALAIRFESPLASTIWNTTIRAMHPGGRSVEVKENDLGDRCSAIEECYEFMLAYAAQGLPSDQGSQTGGQLREFLGRAVEAVSGLADAYEAAVNGMACIRPSDTRRF